MIYTSLAVLAMSASAAVSPLARMIHFHPRTAQPDTRVSITLHNSNTTFQDVRVAGRSYTILAERGITIKAPAGTLVYADGPGGAHRRGEVLLEMSSASNLQTINFR